MYQKPISASRRGTHRFHLGCREREIGSPVLALVHWFVSSTLPWGYGVRLVWNMSVAVHCRLLVCTS